MTVSEPPPLLAFGTTVQLSATVRDTASNVLTGRTITWSSANASIASVSSSGLVTGAAAGGPVSITATSEGKSASVAVSVCLVGLYPPNGSTTMTIVSANLGSDAGGSGSCVTPFKTVTRGLAGRASGEVVWVTPGIYDAANGEVFPIVLPDGVVLVGDEANKGNGATPTRIIGAAQGVAGIACGYQTVLQVGAGATIAGLELTNPNSVFGAMTLAVGSNAVVIRNNRLVNNPGTYTAIYVCNGAENLVITGNVISDNGGLGIGFISGGAGSRVENNIITRNGTGIEFDAPYGDFGGGGAGSVGGNVISCNTRNDVWTNRGPSTTLYLANNAWDHAPPSGNDIFNNSGATLVVTGGSVAAGACP